ncbi:craniofacial development protein 2-like [Macrobrachium rosenbergii]|uniref:craniofacial development protein 2-like n=1 Tax=Macrobrachium rosenbergii TaxID=79674 RepID=UPI0034D79FED
MCLVYIYRAGCAQTLISEVKKHQLDITALQETRWTGNEESDDDEKGDFYEKLQEAAVQTPKHDVTVVLDDFNAKTGHEVDALGPATGRHGAHEVSSENGIRLTSFANSNGMVVGGTIFPHQEIHKHMWNSPEGITRNQMDHKFRGSLMDVHNFRGAECDSDHNLVIARVKIKLNMKRNSRNERKEKFDTDELKR